MKFDVTLCIGGMEGNETKEEPSEELMVMLLLELGGWFLCELYVYVLLYV